jgi:hypothetical protein
MFVWDMWKKGFDAWESATASYMEQVIKNPLLLGPSGKLMAEGFKGKAKADQAMAQWVGMMGLATKRDQERTLHALNQIQSKLADLEEKLAERK